MASIGQQSEGCNGARSSIVTADELEVLRADLRSLQVDLNLRFSGIDTRLANIEARVNGIPPAVRVGTHAVSERAPFIALARSQGVPAGIGCAS
jgi:hypothetical protein